MDNFYSARAEAEARIKKLRVDAVLARNEAQQLVEKADVTGRHAVALEDMADQYEAILAGTTHP